MRRIALFMLVATLVVALTVATAMAAPGGQGKDQGKGKGQAKVTICHKGETITVAMPALKGHLKHGDTEGECVTTPAPEPTA